MDIFDFLSGKIFGKNDFWVKSILPDLKRAGYDRSLEVVLRDGATPLFDSLMDIGTRHSFSEVDLDEANLCIRLPEGMTVDLGGIAKGWIAEHAARLLSEHAVTAAVNAGGDMFLVGLPAAGHLVTQVLPAALAAYDSD